MKFSKEELALVRKRIDLDIKRSLKMAHLTQGKDGYWRKKK